MTTTAFRNARIVLPDEVVTGSLAVADGLIDAMIALVEDQVGLDA